MVGIWVSRVTGATERMKVKKETEWIYEQRVIAGLIKVECHYSDR